MKSFLDGRDDAAEVRIIGGKEQADKPVQETVPPFGRETLQATQIG